jgi:hypothetical protein
MGMCTSIRQYGTKDGAKVILNVCSAISGLIKTGLLSHRSPYDSINLAEWYNYFKVSHPDNILW